MSMDAIQRFFDWAEDNHYLSTTKEIINAASKQVATLEALVREIAQTKLERYPHFNIHLIKEWQDKAKKIMEEKP